VEREARRRFILDAARRILASKGVESATMEEIASASGYTRRSLYAYFRNREEILLEVLSEDLRDRWALQKMAVARGATALEKVRIWAQVLYEVSRANPQTLQLQVYADFRGINRKRIRSEIFSRFQPINQDLAEGLREILRMGIADGSLRPDLNIDLCITNFVHSFRAILHHALTPSYSFAKFPPDILVGHFLDLFCRAIRSDQGEAND
jgi:TetR/AcrR family transcriptional regulator